ncbi:ATP-dependent endonuclease [Gilliamella sp. Pas-s27]|uniref:ATP-dependent nuclease n=1 Tax=Gilliamella sp. Pas-s27 TaxID=2687311 RepID=UPI0013652DE6|nr:AAA family ATPase [Gilliamella sp. Pas-s27]MWP47651.1 AAA family ATPase [Gilliamella sp. Pas-s27]
MYIKKVKINNYRNFRNFEAILQKLTVVVGENCTGKSNFFSALSLPLASNSIAYNQKKLNVSDINRESIKEFYRSIINREPEEEQLNKIPKVTITLQFVEPKNSYEKAILFNWLIKDEDEDCFKIRYDFKPKDNKEFLNTVRSLLKDSKIEDINCFTLPIEFYDYQIVSVNNEKLISFNELKNIKINHINAERDNFSDSSTMKSNSILTRLLINNLNETEKNIINQAYINFFSEIERTKTFEKIIQINEEFENITDHLKQLECIPNLPNLKNILSNITLRYGEEFLYQRGLGQRNLIYIFILFAYYKINKSTFNLCCIEEPEAHLSVNNLKLVTDFIHKSVNNSNSLLQTIISTHSPTVINKLKLSNVLVLTGEKAINLSNTSQELLNYLRKRPNFDILKLLFANKVILVEGTTEEMLINAFLTRNCSRLNNIEVISINQKGFKTFLDVWLILNKENNKKKIGIIRDFDNQHNAKNEHQQYDIKNENITVRTTTKYTLEDDFVATNNNLKSLNKLFKKNFNQDEMSKHLKSDKAEGMLLICDTLLKNEIELSLPTHIDEVIRKISC